MKAISKICSPCGLEIEEKRVTSISPEDDFSIQDVRKDEKLKSAEAEMGGVREENERLKMTLEQVEEDSHSLQLRFFDILRKEVSMKGVADSATTLDESKEPELVSLCLGRSPREPNKDARIGNSNKRKENEDLELCLTLGLDSKCLLSIEQVSDLSHMNGSEDPNEAEAEGTLSLSTHKSVKVKNANDEISDQKPAKRARVSVRARCDTPTMNDGCQWRKYGQKIAKRNPCPRAYYRCTVAPACPVRKQVQRCADDLSILITTYEGTHNHPLPFSATAIASTTSAAASMLLSGSSTSQLKSHNSASFENAPTVLNGLSFTQQFDQSRAKQVLLPNNASHLFPTITLDLTSASSSSSTYVHCLSSSIASNPRFSPTSLSFCSPEPNMTPSFWGKGFPNNGTMPIDKTHIRPVILRSQFQQHIYQQCKKNQTPSEDALAETMTKAFSTDPSLRSVIAAAVSSIVGQGSSTSGNQEGREILSSGLNLKLQEEHPQLGCSSPLNQHNKGCLTGYFKRLSSSSSHAGEFMLVQPQLPFSLSKSSTSTPASIVDHINN